MRYIYYIIIIFLLLSAIVGLELRSKRSPTKDAALIINNRVISTDEFNGLYASRPLYQGGQRGKSDFINSLITKELLIQESQREGIDKEESFRQSIQNFYEQSLIKLLIDRKFASLHVTVSDEDVNRYIALMDKKLHLTIFTFSSPEEAEKGIYKNGESKTVSFRDLSKTMQDIIIPVRKGGMTHPVRSGDKYIVVRLDGMEKTSAKMPSPPEREEIKKMLFEDKKEEMISDWISDLRKTASIKILVKEEN
jgi:parvulin-like peptidyl-prolyl isomerase